MRVCVLSLLPPSNLLVIDTDAASLRLVSLGQDVNVRPGGVKTVAGVLQQYGGSDHKDGSGE